MTKTLYVTGKMYEANTVSITDAELVEMRKAGATYRGISDWMALTQERKMTFMGVKRVLVMEGMV